MADISSEPHFPRKVSLESRFAITWMISTRGSIGIAITNRRSGEYPPSDSLQGQHWLTGQTGSGSLRFPIMTIEELLAELRSSPTDLARVVEAVSSRELPYVLVPIAALKGWQERDPDAWRKVEAWLIVRGTNVVEV